ncbi:hypothetical protein AAEU76_004977 [Salmonella enterica subsp. enterica serovar Wedding]
MMKRAGNTGLMNIIIRKATSGLYKGKGGNRPAPLSRQGVMTGMALLLSAGMCGEARADLVVTFTYTVLANTCTLSSTGATTDGAINASSVFDVNWGAVTSRQLTAQVKKTFGVSMTCAGLPYAPSLTITGSNSTTQNSVLYVSDTPGSVAGFAVSAENSSGATETDKTTEALTTGGEISLAENTSKKILLTAWPTLMPGKSQDDLSGAGDIRGSVTINVSYN